MLIERDLWMDDQYAKLNVIYKAAKNPKKMITALEKHEKVLRKYAESFSAEASGTPIGTTSRLAFDAIMDFYDKKIESSEIQQIIEPAIMYQRMLNKLKEIFTNNLVVDRWETEKGLVAIIRSYAVFDYLKVILEAENYSLNASVMNAADYGAPQKRMRFVLQWSQIHLCLYFSRSTPSII